MKNLIPIIFALAVIGLFVSYFAGAETINVTPGGAGGGGGAGTVTSIATGCLASGGTITTIGTISTSQISVAHATGDTINGSECGELGTFNSGSAIAITLPQAGTGLFIAGWYEDYTNYGTGTVTFTTSTSTFLSAGTPSTYAITQGQGVRFTASTVSPGNWEVSNVGVGQSIPLPVSGASGGTGVSNSGGKTITIGASFTTTGAGAPTLAFPAGSQTYTFPNASSTIVDLSSSQALTGKTIDGSSIGSITPGSGAFTTLSATGQITSTLAIGTAPFVVTSTTNVANLNASTLTGSAIGTSGATIPLLSTANTWTLGQTFSAVLSDVQTVNGNAGLVGIRNTSSGVTAQGAFNFGNNTSNTEVTMTLNGGAFTGAGNQFVINSVGNAFLSGNGTTAVGWQTGGAVSLPNIASSSAAQTGTVCWTTGGGNLTVDTTVACLASLEELKNIKGPIVGALDEILALKPFWYSWKDDAHYKMDPHDQPGLGAHQVESIDSRLAGYDPEGKLTGVRYQQMVAVLVAAIQEQQQEIETLKAQMQERHAGIQ